MSKGIHLAFEVEGHQLKPAKMTGVSIQTQNIVSLFWQKSLEMDIFIYMNVLCIMHWEKSLNMDTISLQWE